MACPCLVGLERTFFHPIPREGPSGGEGRGEDALLMLQLEFLLQELLQQLLQLAEQQRVQQLSFQLPALP